MKTVIGMCFLTATLNAAVIYDFTFTGNNGMDATGTLTIDNGYAQLGSINITGIQIEHPIAGDPASVSLTGIQLIPANGTANMGNHNGDVISFDNAVNPTSNPLVDYWGLGFGSGQYDSWHYNSLANLWGNSPDSYSLFVGEAGTHANGVVDNEFVYFQDNGSMTITAVPEPGTLLNGILAFGLVIGSSIYIRKNTPKIG